MESEIILLIAGIVVGLTIGIIIATKSYKQQIQSKIEQIKTEQELEFTKRIDGIRKESNERQRNSVKGKIGEQLAPLFPEFSEKYESADARFIGTPIDYIVFKNMSKFSNSEREPIEVVFVEIKTGKTSSLKPIENAVKDAIDNKRVRFETLKIQPDLDSNSV